MLKLSLQMQYVSAATEEISAGMEKTVATTMEMNTTSTEIQKTIETIASKAKSLSHFGT
ncbi:hypothetical protein [Clostridium chromiireducens]|uniref:hypothetical protein n=1 Tax=Clostridium chromiireducens TaxID=225345 RepID=UPI0015F911AC|nr:hypothetical protein [Clostridium chromiireducens]